jgi:hypothetical protein
MCIKLENVCNFEVTMHVLEMYAQTFHWPGTNNNCELSVIKIIFAINFG